MAKLLILAAGRRRYVVEALRATAGTHDVLLVADADVDTPGLHVEGTVSLEEPRDPDEATSWLFDLCARGTADAVLSLHDYQTIRVSAVKTRLNELGVRWIGPSNALAKTLLDKIRLAEYLDALDPTLSIPTYASGDVLPDEPLRWVVKERYGSGSSGLALALSKEDAMGRLQNPELVAQPMLSAQEWNMDAFVWHDGRIRGFSAKKKLRMRGGETEAAEVVPTSDLDFDLNPLIRALEGIDHTGNIDIDIFVEAGGIRVLDVNPRFGGGFAFSVRAGYRGGEATWGLLNTETSPFSVQATRRFRGAKSIEVVQLAG